MTEMVVKQMVRRVMTLEGPTCSDNTMGLEMATRVGRSCPWLHAQRSSSCVLNEQQHQISGCLEESWWQAYRLWVGVSPQDD